MRPQRQRGPGCTSNLGCWWETRGPPGFTHDRPCDPRILRFVLHVYVVKSSYAGMGGNNVNTCLLLASRNSIKQPLHLITFTLGVPSCLDPPDRDSSPY